MEDNLSFLACFDLEWHVKGALGFSECDHKSGPRVRFHVVELRDRHKHDIKPDFFQGLIMAACVILYLPLSL